MAALSYLAIKLVLLGHVPTIFLLPVLKIVRLGCLIKFVNGMEKGASLEKTVIIMQFSRLMMLID